MAPAKFRRIRLCTTCSPISDYKVTPYRQNPNSTARLRMAASSVGSRRSTGRTCQRTQVHDLFPMRPTLAVHSSSLFPNTVNSSTPTGSRAVSHRTTSLMWQGVYGRSFNNEDRLRGSRCRRYPKACLCWIESPGREGSPARHEQNSRPLMTVHTSWVNGGSGGPSGYPSSASSRVALPSPSPSSMS